MIVTLTLNEININNRKIFFPKENLDDRFKLSKQSRSYKSNKGNFEYELLCPEIVNENGDREVLWPAFKLPYRKYPVHIYIYAAALYLSSDKSMRAVASEVRRKFCLEKFSHSTVSRSLKKLSENLEILSRLMETNDNCKSLFKRKRWSCEKEELMSKLFTIISPILEESKTEYYGSMLNFKFFKETGKFPL